MTLKPLKTLRYPDRVRLEYELVEPVDAQGYQPHHPQTFANEPGDDRCTWANLRRLCVPGHATEDDCVKAAWELLRKEAEGSEDTSTEAFDQKLAQAILGIEPEA